MVIVNIQVYIKSEEFLILVTSFCLFAFLRQDLIILSLYHGINNHDTSAFQVAGIIHMQHCT